MKIKKTTIFFIFCLIIQVSQLKAEMIASANNTGVVNCIEDSHEKYVISLSGKWNFCLDANRKGVNEKWYETTLPDRIELPGSCEQHGYGTKNADRDMNRLTRVIKYEGLAWYQRDFDIPKNWAGKRIELMLERCHWESNIWIDSKPYGMQNSLSAPHIYDLATLSPGRHTLTICIDNTYKIPIGTWAHAITEDTQGNWNGIIGRIELKATDLVWIKDAQVYEDHLLVKIGNNTGKSIQGTLQHSSCIIPSGETTIKLPFKSDAKVWNEFSPALHKLTITLKAGKYKDQKNVTYGLRQLGTKNKQFTINGRPFLMRGPVDECVYPLTGYPPMDKKAWLKILSICKSYGFNYMRFHSWCPPEAAFEAGDELGFFFQVELPLWTMDAPAFGKDKPRDQFIKEELNRILDAYGSHPSFALMAMGNESWGSLDELVKQGRDRDNRHLYRCENGNTSANGDYYEIGQRGTLGPRTDWDRWSSPLSWIANGGVSDLRNQPTVPTLSHEVGQWEMYPDLNEVKKYIGTLRAYNFEYYRQSLEAHHMLDLAPKLKEASGKFSMLLYKEEIEACMRTYPYGGFQVLEARDYPGQGTAIVGWLDAFWDSKGLITPAEFRRFCAPVVCLMRMPKRIFTSGESFNGEAEIANYSTASITTVPQWIIKDTRGKIIAQGTLQKKNIETGHVSSVGNINASLTVTQPEKLEVTMKGAGTSNSWNIWVYPDTPVKVPDNVRIAHAFDQQTIDALNAGEKVLLFSSPEEGVIVRRRDMYAPDSLRYLPPAQPGKNAIPGSFMPVFWNTRLFNQIGTMGILCDPEHPALAEFPTDNHSDWQWADLLGRFTAAESFGVAGGPLIGVANEKMDRSKAIILDDTPADYRPIVMAIDNYNRNSKLGIIFESKVGKGKLLVCAMDLEKEASTRPAARQMEQSLLDYMTGNQFDPAFELSLELLKRVLTY